MYQINGRLGISNQRVRYPSFQFIVRLFSYYQLIPLSIILCFFGISRVEPKLLQYISGTLTDHSLSGPPKYHSLLASHPVEPHLTDQSSLDLHKSLNLNIASYFINTIASPHANTWHHICGPITQTIDLFCLNPNHRRSVEHTWKNIDQFYRAGVKYTGRNVTKKYGRTYLLSSSYEINLLANSMQNRLGLRYTNLPINCNRQTHGDNSASRSTVNLAFRRLQPKITKIQKIQ